MTQPDPQVAPPVISIVSYRRADLLRACLDSVREHAPDHPVRVFDNRSDGTPEVRALAAEYPEVSWTFAEDNHGFAYAVNRMAEAHDGDFVLLNPDAVLTKPIDALVRALRERERCACVAPLNTSLPRPWDVAHRRSNVARALVSHAGYSHQTRRWPVSELYPVAPTGPVGYLGGAFLVVSRAAWDAVGPFDEQFFLYSEEVDWQERCARAGWGAYLHDEELFVHSSHGTAGGSSSELTRSVMLLRKSQYLYLAKHYNRLHAGLFRRGLGFLDRVQRSKRGFRNSPFNKDWK